MNANGGLMANYVKKYFNDMYDHAHQVTQVCNKHCRLAYVVGNSKFYGHPLPTDEILASLFQHFGFMSDRIDKTAQSPEQDGFVRSRCIYEPVIGSGRDNYQDH